MKKLPEVKLLFPIFAFHINQLNEDYTYLLSSLLSRKHCLRRLECECSTLELCSAQCSPSSTPTPILRQLFSNQKEPTASDHPAISCILAGRLLPRLGSSVSLEDLTPHTTKIPHEISPETSSSVQI